MNKSEYGGFYRATVINVQDPTNRRRVKLRVPAVFGDIVTGWAEPLFDSLIPREGSRVWAAFEAGNKDYPLYLGPRAVSFYPALVTAVAGAQVEVSVPELFGGEKTEWVPPLQDGPNPEIGDTVWLALQEQFSPTVQPGRSQLVYINPRVPVPTGGSPDLALAYTAPFRLEWIARNDHTH